MARYERGEDEFLPDHEYEDGQYPQPLPDPTDPGNPGDPGGTTPPAPPPGGGSTPPKPPADPWDTAPSDGNWEHWFMANVQGLAPSPTALAGLEQRLAKHGIKVLRNAAGIAGKIQLPNGSIIDVGQAFSGGNPAMMKWQWMTGDGGGDDGTSIEVNPEYLTPFTEQFSTPDGAKPLGDFSYDPYKAPEDFSYDGYKGPSEFSYDPYRPGAAFTPKQFAAPTGDTLFTDPGYQFRADQGRKTLEMSAAARGLLNSGGTLKDLINHGQNFASQEYQNAWNRAFDTWSANAAQAKATYDTNRNNAFETWGANAAKNLSAYTTNRNNAYDNHSLNQAGRTNAYNQAWQQYVERKDTHYRNQNEAWKKLYEAASLGAGASA